MKNTKEILVISLLALFPLVAGAQSSSTTQSNHVPSNQPKPFVVATVNLQNGAVITQEGNNLTIGFSLTNRVGAQPKIRYGVYLAKNEGISRGVVDKKVYDEVLSLSENDRIDRVINYNAPQFLKGQYDLFIEARTGEGMALGKLLVATVDLSGSGEYLEIVPDSCFLTIDGEKIATKYKIDQGVDVSSQERLVATCEIKNYFKKDISAKALFSTNAVNIFGEFVETKESDAVQVPLGKSIMKKIAIPKPENPKAYDSVLFIQDSDGNVISNSIIIHYVVQGLSATIKNVVLDKDYYNIREVARVSLYWTGSADLFPGSRSNNSDSANLKAGITIRDFRGFQCSQNFSKEIGKSAEKMEDFEVPIIAECKNPEASITISDESGRVISQSNFKVESKNLQNETANLQKDDKYKSSLSKTTKIILTVAGLLIVIIFFWLNKRNKSLKNTLIILAMFFSYCFLGTMNADADTFTIFLTIGGDRAGMQSDDIQVDFTANLDKSNYMPGDRMKVTGEAELAKCNNGASPADLEARITKSLYGRDRFFGSKSILNQTVDSDESFADGNYMGSVEVTGMLELNSNKSIFNRDSIELEYKVGTGLNDCEKETCSYTFCHNNEEWVRGTKACPVEPGCPNDFCSDEQCYAGGSSLIYGKKDCGWSGCPNEYCKQSTCWNGTAYIPGTSNCPLENGCEAGTCKGSYCDNGIRYVAGTKNCPVVPCENETCEGVYCDNGQEWVLGKKQCQSNNCEKNTCEAFQCYNGYRWIKGLLDSLGTGKCEFVEATNQNCRAIDNGKYIVTKFATCYGIGCGGTPQEGKDNIVYYTDAAGVQYQRMRGIGDAGGSIVENNICGSGCADQTKFCGSMKAKLNFWADKNAILEGEKVTLNWTSDNALKCYANSRAGINYDGGWNLGEQVYYNSNLNVGYLKELFGTQEVGPKVNLLWGIPSRHVYYLQCEDQEGMLTELKEVYVDVFKSSATCEAPNDILNELRVSGQLGKKSFIASGDKIKLYKKNTVNCDPCEGKEYECVNLFPNNKLSPDPDFDTYKFGSCEQKTVGCVPRSDPKLDTAGKYKEVSP